MVIEAWKRAQSLQRQDLPKLLSKAFYRAPCFFSKGALLLPLYASTCSATPTPTQDKPQNFVFFNDQLINSKDLSWPPFFSWCYCCYSHSFSCSCCCYYCYCYYTTTTATTITATTTTFTNVLVPPLRLLLPLPLLPPLLPPQPPLRHYGVATPLLLVLLLLLLLLLPASPLGLLPPLYYYTTP